MPVLIIGVGGTGTEVVKRVNDVFLEQHGETPPHVALGVIDARTGQPQTGYVPGIEFTANTQVNFTSEFHRMRQEGHLPWWPEEVSPLSRVDFSDGCGAMRSYGRFFAHYFAGNIDQTVRSMHGRLATLRPDRAHAASDSWEVYVVCSLGNGTGGGTFMEVATIAKAVLAEYVPTSQVLCTGVFIPGSVTRDGNPGRRRIRVGANGFAALYELQYEFNRAAPGDAVKPRGVHELVGQDRTYRCGDGPEAMPYDGVYLLDGANANGKTADYSTLLHMAAHSLALLVGGVDENARLLDAWVTAANEAKFASLAAVTLTAPAEHIQRWAVNALAERTLALARSKRTAAWRELLADASPDETQRLLPEDVSIADSAAFFLEHVLQMRETGPGGGAQHNQLFDLFEAGDRDDDELSHEFEGLLSKALRTDDRNKMVAQARNIAEWVDQQTDLLTEQRELLLLTGSRSLWGRVPDDPTAPTGAGLEWLIDARVRQFVDAGAFGPLVAWLDELQDLLEQNKASIDQHEKARITGQEDAAHIDLTAKTNLLKKEADSFFARFRQGAIVEGLRKVHSAAKEKFEFKVWATKIDAVERLYDRAIAHVDGLARAAEETARFLAHERLDGLVARDAEDAANHLDQTLRFEVQMGRGLRPEVYVGGDEAMRAALLERLEASTEASPVALLAGVAESNRRLYQAALNGLHAKRRPSLFGEDDPAEGKRLDEHGRSLADGYRQALTDLGARRAASVIRAETRIDKLMTDEADRMLAAYYETYQVEREAVGQEDKTQLARLFRERVGADTFDRIRRDQRWDTHYDDALEHNRRLYLAGRVRTLLQFAAPMWLLRGGGGTRPPEESSFAVYPAEAKVIGGALQAYRELFAGGGDRVAAELHAHPSSILDPRRVFIARTAVGVTVDALRLDNERTLYDRACREERGFSPHATHDYEVAVSRLLRAATPGHGGGSTLLPLAKTLGLLTADSTGNHSLAIDLAGDPASGRSAVAAGKLGPRGVEAFAGWIDGPDPIATHLSAGLKPVLMGRLRSMAYGDPTTSTAGLGWDGVGRELQAEAARLRARYHAEPDTGLREEMQAQAACLDDLATELVELAGSQPPHALK